MTESPTRDHNASARKGMILDACRRISALDSEISALQQDKAHIKNSIIKGDLGMKVSDFNIALRIHKLEGDDRNTLFDTLKECFAALEVGAQLNFLDAVGAEKTPVPEKAAAPKTGRRGKRNPTPEQLGETANKPHEPITSDEEFEAAAPKTGRRGKRNPTPEQLGETEIPDSLRRPQPEESDESIPL